MTPTSTAPPCWAHDGTVALRWITAPVSGSVAITGNVDYSFGCGQSNAGLNSGVRLIVYRWSVKAGGIVSIIDTSADSVECTGTGLTLRTIAAAAVDTTPTLDVGDRIVVDARLINIGTWGGNSNRTFNFGYDGIAAGTGDAFVNFATPTAAFSADSNNARRVISLLWDALFKPWAWGGSR
jgi:hypothetical protein